MDGTDCWIRGWEFIDQKHVSSEGFGPGDARDMVKAGKRNCWRQYVLDTQWHELSEKYIVGAAGNWSVADWELLLIGWGEVSKTHQHEGSFLDKLQGLESQ